MVFATRKPLLALALILAVAAILSGAQHDFQTGKLINIDSDERLIDGTTYRWALFTVQVGDMIFTARGERVRKHSGDPGKGLIVGDPVQVAIDGENLRLLKPNGKEIKAKITKRARAQ